MGLVLGNRSFGHILWSCTLPSSIPVSLSLSLLSDQHEVGAVLLCQMPPAMVLSLTQAHGCGSSHF